MPSATSAGERRARPCADENAAPDAVDRAGNSVDRQGPRTGCIEHARRQEGVPGLAEDRDRRNDDEHAFQHHGEIFGLVVAVRMVGVGRLALKRMATSAATAVATLTMLSSASEKAPRCR